MKQNRIILHSLASLGILLGASQGLVLADTKVNQALASALEQEQGVEAGPALLNAVENAVKGKSTEEAADIVKSAISIGRNLELPLMQPSPDAANNVKWMIQSWEKAPGDEVPEGSAIVTLTALPPNEALPPAVTRATASGKLQSQFYQIGQIVDGPDVCNLTVSGPQIAAPIALAAMEGNLESACAIAATAAEACPEAASSVVSTLTAYYPALGPTLETAVPASR